MNKILKMIILFFSAFLHASDNHKDVTASDLNDSHHHNKLKKKPKFFHFKEWDGEELSPIIENQKKYNYPPVDTSRLLLPCNLKQMRKEQMNSITHCLKGDALALRVYNLDEESLGIVNPEVKNFIMEIIKSRIKISSSSQDQIKSMTAKKIRQCINHFALEYIDYTLKIIEEPHGLELIAFIEMELSLINKDLRQRVPDECLKDGIRNISNTIDGNEFCYSIAAKNDRNMENLFESYRTMRSISSLQTDTQSREFFNQLHLLEQAVICDDNLTKAELQLRYQNIQELYQTLELSELAKIYARGSLNSLQKSIEVFEESNF
ncbi:MAG: hypothetical protein JO129_01075 [Candidatus Dependentiae bacterium]|nr:hypothetical protein [Candidatus Dependentiae bacterium]